MNNDHSHEHVPESPSTEQRQAEPSSMANAGRLVLGERAASNLIRMATAAGATIADLDDDPTLRVTAHALGRGYLAVDLYAVDDPPDRPADLVAFRWPRPGDQTWLSSAGEVFAGVHQLLTPMGQVAVLLDPTPALAFGITWTGSVLAAANRAGLPVLQDIVCVHDVEAAAARQPDAPVPVTLRHRVIPVFRTARARHAQH